MAEKQAKAESLFALRSPAMKVVRKTQLSDDTILAVLSQLRRAGSPVSCALLRRELRAQTGRAGGVRRVYRIWEASMRQTDSAPLRPVEASEERVAQLEAELAQALERATLAEHRERSHQDTWAREIDQLRQRLKAYAPLEYRPGQQAEQVLNLHRQLHAARERIFELETRLAARSGVPSPQTQDVEEGE